MNEIKKERDYLEEELFSLKNESFGDKDVSNLVIKVRLLISDFERIFNEAPVHLKKKLIRIFVEKIEFDSETESINFYVRKVPWIDDKLRERYDFGSNLHKAELFTTIKANQRSGRIASVN